MIRTFTRQPYYHKRRRRFLPRTNVISISLSDTLSLSQNISFNTGEQATVSQTLSLAQSISTQQVAHETISQSLSFSQTITFNRISQLHVNQTFTPTQTITALKVLQRSISDSLHFTPSNETTQLLTTTYEYTESFCLAIGNSPIHDAFIIRDCINADFTHRNVIYDRSVAQSIIFTDHITTAVVNVPTFKSVSQTITFTDHITNSLHSAGHVSATVTQTFAPTDHFTFILLTAYSESLSQTLSLTQSISKVKTQFRSLSDTFVPSQSNSKKKIATKRIKDVFAPTSVVAKNVVYGRSLISPLVFNEDHYDVNVGGTIVHVPIIITTPIPGKLKAILYVMLQSKAASVLLPAPLFDNSYKNKNLIKVGRVMSGGTRVYIKPSRNKLLKYNFVLTESKKIELFDFIETNSNEVITVTDWKKSKWVTYLTSDPISATGTGRDKVEIELQFEGLQIA